MKNLIGTTIALLMMLSLVQAMPLHPRVVQMVKDGILPESALENPQFYAQRGINQGKPNRLAALDQPSGQFKILAILVNFSDHPSQVAPSYFDNLLYGTTGNTVRTFYTLASYGNLDIITVNLPSALGWKTLPQTYAYYVDGQKGFGSYPHNAQKLAEDAISAANPYVNFSNYDNDNDGYVDALVIIHSGPGYEYSGNVNDIHSHAWSCFIPQYVDGKIVTSYSMEPEYWSNPNDMTCGVYCHELGHVFGLPDFYDYGYDSRGLGSWSVMAGGSWNGSSGSSPACFDAFSKIYLGFVTPINLTLNTSQVSFPAVIDTGVIYKLWTNGGSSQEYFLVENRQKTGFDTYLPAAGLNIYHVDEAVGGNDNQWYPGYTTYGHYEVAIEQADGLWDLEHNTDGGDTGDPFPGSTNNRTFNSTSTPNAKSYADAVTYVSVTNISNSGSIMTADLTVANAPAIPTLVTPINGGYTNNRRPLFDFSDSPGATKYHIQVDDSTDFAFPVINDNNVLASQFTPPGNLSDHRYYWRVRAFNGSAWSGWSNMWNIIVDATAPTAPLNLLANGANPTTWTNGSNILINWSNPTDLSGIKRNLYKVGSAPTSAFDTTHSIGPIPPVYLTMTTSGSQTVYFWLLDNAGNAAYQNTAQVVINYDGIRPSGSIAVSTDTSASLSFRVNWSRGEDTGGSGLSNHYTVKVKTDNGAWQVWQLNVTDTTALCTGQHGHTYSFESACYDNAGNVELYTSVAEAVTVIDTNAFIAGDANHDGLVRGSDVIYLVGFFKGFNPEPTPLRAGDANGDCQVLGGDVTYLVRYFKGIGDPPIRGACD
jgi:M6 family metalloprotease-like protein